MSWRDRAACIGQHELMTHPQRHRSRQARKVCEACPVLQECRRWAYSSARNLLTPGMVAGTTFTERVSILCPHAPTGKVCAPCKVKIGHRQDDLEDIDVSTLNHHPNVA